MLSTREIFPDVLIASDCGGLVGVPALKGGTAKGRPGRNQTAGTGTAIRPKREEGKEGRLPRSSVNINALCCSPSRRAARAIPLPSPRTPGSGQPRPESGVLASETQAFRACPRHRSAAVPPSPPPPRQSENLVKCPFPSTQQSGAAQTLTSTSAPAPRDTEP